MSTKIQLTNSQRSRLLQLKESEPRIHAAVVFCIRKAPELAEMVIKLGMKAFIVQADRPAESPVMSIGDDILRMLGQPPAPEVKRVEPKTDEEIERGLAWALDNHQPKRATLPTGWELRHR